MTDRKAPAASAAAAAAVATAATATIAAPGATATVALGSPSSSPPPPPRLLLPADVMRQYLVPCLSGREFARLLCCAPAFTRALDVDAVWHAKASAEFGGAAVVERAHATWQAQRATAWQQREDARLAHAAAQDAEQAAWDAQSARIKAYYAELAATGQWNPKAHAPLPALPPGLRTLKGSRPRREPTPAAAPRPAPVTWRATYVRLHQRESDDRTSFVATPTQWPALPAGADPSTERTHHYVPVVVVGDKGSGKSALCRAAATGAYDDTPRAAQVWRVHHLLPSTLTNDNGAASVEAPGGTRYVRLELHDPPQPYFEQFRNPLLWHVDGVFAPTLLLVDPCRAPGSTHPVLLHMQAQAQAEAHAAPAAAAAGMPDGPVQWATQAVCEDADAMARDAKGERNRAAVATQILTVAGAYITQLDTAMNRRRGSLIVLSTKADQTGQPGVTRYLRAAELDAWAHVVGAVAPPIECSAKASGTRGIVRALRLCVAARVRPGRVPTLHPAPKPDPKWANYPKSNSRVDVCAVM